MLTKHAMADHQPFDDYVRCQFRAWAKASGLSRRELGVPLEWNAQKVIDYFGGRHGIDLPRVLAWCAFFNQPVRALLRPTASSGSVPRGTMVDFPAMTTKEERPTDTADYQRTDFAKAALTGLLMGRHPGPGMEATFAREAWALADAMLANKPPAPDK
jgi:hypothetical protein